MDKRYYVYILASRSRNLYTGVTGHLQRRLLEHRQNLIPGFTSRYRIFRLVHFEVFRDIRNAIAREKEIKAWRRQKKIRLIEQENPTWEDLAAVVPAKDYTSRSKSEASQATNGEEKADPSRHPQKTRLGSG
ncbi:MAG: GIY-YIG nuclease family protein [Candidatus Acidiferrales bacterium]